MYLSPKKNPSLEGTLDLTRKSAGARIPRTSINIPKAEFEGLRNVNFACQPLRYVSFVLKIEVVANLGFTTDACVPKRSCNLFRELHSRPYYSLKENIQCKSAEQVPPVIAFNPFRFVFPVVSHETK